MAVAVERRSTVPVLDPWYAAPADHTPGSPVDFDGLGGKLARPVTSLCAAGLRALAPAPEVAARGKTCRAATRGAIRLGEFGRSGRHGRRPDTSSWRARSRSPVVAHGGAQRVLRVPAEGELHRWSWLAAGRDQDGGVPGTIVQHPGIDERLVEGLEVFSTTIESPATARSRVRSSGRRASSRTRSYRPARRVPRSTPASIVPRARPPSPDRTVTGPPRSGPRSRTLDS
jgi:hypothetical protein